MTYRSLQDAVLDLEAKGMLRRVDVPVDPNLEMAEIQRRVYRAGGPALLFTKAKGSAFPCLANLYGSRERTHYLFRKTLEPVKALLSLKRDPMGWLTHPWKHRYAPILGLRALPRPVLNPAVSGFATTVDRLPQIVSWPKDGGAYITLPQVYTENPDRPGILGSNLGMYRIQISGGEYRAGEEVGLHYQIHRGIGVHHHAAIRRGEKLKVSIFVGGPPAHALAAVMPLPEGMPEVAFAGMLAGRAFRYARRGGHLLSADADFCITGTIDPARTLPEGPFGDHLGYYSLAHPFPVMKVEKVWHRQGAIWPFTVVGRPPQEDSHLSEIIHEFAGPVLPSVIPGVHAVHAVEASGVHPLLLALASERYVPYEDAASRRPRELLTHAHAILGFGQLSLAKYLLIAAKEDAPKLEIRDVGAFLRHMLERVDWSADLHFETRTTMDTLDYSGTGLNAGSKVVIAAAGPRRRELGTELPAAAAQSLPEGFSGLRLAMPGVLAVSGPAYTVGAGEGAGKGGNAGDARNSVARLIQAWEARFGNPEARELTGFPLVVIADDADFTAKSLGNFLWVAFTRSDPARDIQGLWAGSEDKHWGCRGPLIIDARRKPQHAPPLEEDSEVGRKVDALAAPGGSLHGLF